MGARAVMHLHRGHTIGRRDVTRRELEIIRLLAKGYTNRDIADDCKISEQTVKNHMSRIMLKLEAVNRTHAVLSAIKMGLVPKLQDSSIAARRRQGAVH